MFPLFEFIELLPLDIHKARWNVGIKESLLEGSPSDDLAFSENGLVVFPPNGRRSLQLVRCIGYLLLTIALSNGQLCKIEEAD